MSGRVRYVLKMTLRSRWTLLIGLMTLVVACSGMIHAGAQQRTLAGVNEDIQVIAGLLLAQLLTDRPNQLVAEEMRQLALSGKTPAVRAAAAQGFIFATRFDVTYHIVAFQFVPQAEAAGQMEFAYASAAIPLNSAREFNILSRGAIEGLRLMDDCLTGGDIHVGNYLLECSKYKAFQAVIANEVLSGTLSFLATILNIDCEFLLKRAQTGLAVGPLNPETGQLRHTFVERGPWSGIKMAAARAWVAGVVVKQTRDLCVEQNKETMLSLARQAAQNGQTELLEEIVGLDYQVYNVDGAGVPDKPLAIYTSLVEPRGLTKILAYEALNADDKAAARTELETLAKDPNETLGLSAYLGLALLWADRDEASLSTDSTNGATAAIRRAATRALLAKLGVVQTSGWKALDGNRVCLQKLASGEMCE